MWILFDDARAKGAAPRLYADPQAIVVARTIEEVLPALDQVRRAVAEGAHAAGYLGYEGSYALDPKLAVGARSGEGPLLAFGLYDRFVTPDLAALLPSPDGAYAGEPRPRIGRADYERAAAEVREQLFAGDYYQANLTFG